VQIRERDELIDEAGQLTIDVEDLGDEYLNKSIYDDGFRPHEMTTLIG
jgi:hypothetical protein